MKKKLTLFCLPFAGGNKYSYREYIDKAPSFLNIVPLEYPGRGSRIKEPLVTNTHLLVEDLYKQVVGIIDKGEYAIYGHSMGGLLAYLLTTKILANNRRLPLELFITGTSGPSAPERGEKKRYLMDKKEFVQEIRDLDGMPEEILENEELLYYFEPILRADFEASETYQYKEHPPLNIPITVITGTEEDMEIEDIEMWQKESTFNVDFKRMPGKHFFIFKHTRAVIDIIAKKLSVYTKAYHL